MSVPRLSFHCKDYFSVNYDLCLPGFRDASGGFCTPLQHNSMDSVPAPPRASGEIARGSSFSRHGSEHLKRRNPSVRTSLNGNVRQGMLQQQSSSQLQTIRASTSLGQFTPIVS